MTKMSLNEMENVEFELPKLFNYFACVLTLPFENTYFYFLQSVKWRAINYN